VGSNESSATISLQTVDGYECLTVGAKIGGRWPATAATTTNDTRVVVVNEPRATECLSSISCYVITVAVNGYVITVAVGKNCSMKQLI